MAGYESERKLFWGIFEAVDARGRDVMLPRNVAARRDMARVVMAVLPGGDDRFPAIERRTTANGVTTILRLSLDPADGWPGARLITDADPPGLPPRNPGRGPEYLENFHRMLVEANFMEQPQVGVAA